MLLCMASGVLSATVEQNQLSGTTLVDRMINGNFSQHTPFKSKIHKFRSGDNNHRVDGWNYRSMKVGLGKHFNPNWDDNVTVALVPGMDK